LRPYGFYLEEEMKIDEIKVGMVFKLNDKRQNRWVMITAIQRYKDIRDPFIMMVSTRDFPNQPFGTRTTCSRDPSRFHDSPWYKDFSLVSRP
jgi:hypothetical protein